MSGILIATLLATVSAKNPAGFSSGDLLYSDSAVRGNLSSDTQPVGSINGTGTSIWPATHASLPASMKRLSEVTFWITGIDTSPAGGLAHWQAASMPN
ncbi:hypothetical protein [Rhizobium binxianense]|uniref:hypothetical protein n=1 Tax=Rhizobium binxianense TaxID=3024242 RepID=UPI0023A92597|nr:hypothetical protein [Rhizobium sp. MJ22]WEA28092.1 hypothetical protein PO862_11745 [Rhizobium sp. MJ22]